MKYKEYTQTFETEIGQIDIIHIFEPNKQVEIQVWANKSRIYLPEYVLKQTSQTILKKVCKLHKSAANLGVRIGGVK